MTAELNNPDALTPEEQAYIDSMGENPILEDDQGAAEPEAQDEAPAEAEASDQGADEGDEGAQKKSDMVPHGAFHAKTEELKATKAKLREIETQMAVVNDRFERFSQMQQQRQEPVPEPEKIPDKNEDPMAYLDYLEKQFNQFTQQAQQSQQEAARNAEIQNFKAALQAEEAAFSQEQPDYQDAARHLNQHVYKTLQMQGVPPQYLRQRLENELLTIALNAKEAGRSVPQVVYELSQHYGYRGAQPDNVDPALDPAQQQARETLEKVANGQKANKTVAPNGGSSGGKMTLEKFASMSEAEAFAWMDKNPNGYQRLMGS